MKTNKSWLMVSAAVAALTVAQTARGITFGEPDNGRHPNVGTVMFVMPNLTNLPNPAQFISGTLIAPNLFLTAGHGTDYLEWLKGAGVVTFDNTFVTFSDDPTDKASYLRIKAIRTHPGYKRPARVSVEKNIWEYAHGSGSIPVDDMGLIVLETPSDIEPAALPPMGFLDVLKEAKQLNPETKLLAVGFGCRATFRPSTPVGRWEPHNREWVFSEYRGLDPRCLTMSVNEVLGNGGTGYGDSGGPRYWIDPADGSEHLVAITETGSPNLVALDVAYRIDTSTAMDFIQSVKEEFDEPAVLEP